MTILKELFIDSNIIVKKKDIFTKPILILLFFITVAFSPLVIAFAGAWLTKLFTGQDCLNEGNCFWMVLPWLCLMTLPVGLLLMLILIIKYIKAVKKFQLHDTNR